MVQHSSEIWGLGFFSDLSINVIENIKIAISKFVEPGYKKVQLKRDAKRILELKIYISLQIHI